jgi:predicted DNA-binding protein YlxM (UPF0122 family)
MLLFLIQRMSHQIQLITLQRRMIKMNRLTVEGLRNRVQMVMTLMDQELSHYDLQAGIVQIQSLIGEKGLRKISKNQDGYLYYNLTDRANKRKANVYLHHIVLILADAEQYIEQMSREATLNHIDGNKLNNALSNLEYLSQSENSIHAYIEGFKTSQRKEEKNLSEQDVYSILKAYHLADMSYEEIAEAYSLSVYSVKRITKGRINRPLYMMFKALNKEIILHRKTGTAKLTDADVLKILDLFFYQEMSQAAIAEKHNVSRSAVAMIIAGHRWTQVYQQFNKRQVKGA